jgi:hypothetical protein
MIKKGLTIYGKRKLCKRSNALYKCLKNIIVHEKLLQEKSGK